MAGRERFWYPPVASRAIVKGRAVTFDDILGQEPAVSVLKASLQRGRVASAYLFHGPDAVGKRAAAHAFAAALLCPEGEARGDACTTCSSCRILAAGNHEGLVELERAEKKTLIGIDQVHEFGRVMSLRPATGVRTVGVMDEAELSSIEALNALLKLLEEPRPGATMVLVSANRDALPETIRSRCQAVRFRSLSADALARVLRIRFDVPEAEGLRLATLACGSVSGALRIRDMGLVEGEERIDELLGTPGRDPVEVAEALAAMLGRGSAQQRRAQARELILLILERSRRRFIGGDAEARDTEGARYCFESVRKAVDNLSRNLEASAVLKALVIEILPLWTLQTNRY